MKVAKLYDNQGRAIATPTAIEGSISWQAKTGDAYAFAADGKTIIAELKNASVVWIESAGIRFRGAEPIDVSGTKFRLQEWHVSY